MQLSKFTDLGIRVLLVLSAEPDKPATILQIAEHLQVSKNHLMKIVHFMSKQEWLTTIRGKSGGIMLSQAPQNYKVGYLIRILEENTTHENIIVNCHTPSCTLIPACRLPRMLNAAMEHFYNYLDQYSLLDILKQPEMHIVSLARIQH